MPGRPPIAVVVTLRCASGSVAWVSQPCWLTMMSGANAAASSGSSVDTALEPGVLAGLGLERDVDDGPGRLALAGLPLEPRAGEQVPPGLVDRHRQHARVRRVDRLDAVAVVDVEVDVHDPQAGRPGSRDRQRDVVVDAEPAGPRRASRGAGRRPDGTRAGRRRAGSRPSPAATRRRRSPPPRASRGTADRRPARSPPPTRPTGRGRPPRSASRPRGSGPSGRRAAPRPTPARAPGPAPRRAAAAGRSPARTDAASAGGSGRSRTSAIAGRRRAAAGRARADNSRRWSGPTRRRCSTSSASGRARGSRSSATSTRTGRSASCSAERTSDVTIGHAEARHRPRLPRGRLDRRARGASPTSAPRIRPAGGIWVVSRKGRAATIRDVEVIAAARAAGLVDNKVVSFSDTHTSLRLVIPVADRPRG